MSRSLDHLVIGVPDLDAAGEAFAARGLTVGARNRHPWGTENRIIQFADRTFLELIAVADAAAIPPPAPHAFSFGAFVRDALARRAGLSMLVLKSDDARADAAEFAEAGIGDFAPFDFARKGRRPDGNEADVAFSLAFAAATGMPECGFFTCQQHFPQNFWSKPAQTHANGASGIARVTIVADNPSDHHIFLSAFVGERALRASSFGIEIAAGNARIDIVSRAGFLLRYGIEPVMAQTPVFAGIEIFVPSLGALKLAGAHASVAGGLSLPLSPDMTTVLRFVES
jgi:hypothetical protein